jgi:hypothetical protein
MSSAPTDCRVPDPTDAKADGNFGNHRAGYGDRLDRIIATARKGWTLAAGEGLVLVQEIDQLRRERDQLLETKDAIFDNLFRTEEERDAAEANAERRWNDIIAAAKKIERLERILAALRNPSDLMVDALREQIYDLSCFDEALKAIRVAVAAAEKETSTETTR